MVIVEEVTVPSTTGLGGLNEHMGGSVTNGAMDAHESVTPGPLDPPGLVYPKRGLMLIVPDAWLPALTLVGSMGVCTVIVNPGETDTMVTFCGSD
jgi:hypothetical protein